jgi:cobyrinic acid a,c-diamide synthase
VSVARCRALLVSAPASGQGKTTVTAALARRARREGLAVRVFKTGPDFIDPMVLQCAAGSVVHQLDLWMGGEAHCRQLLHQAAQQAELILIEGVMGLYDGAPSSADLALQFDLPVLAVLDASAMAGTFGALALGLAQYRPQLRFHGVVANRVGGERHVQMLRDSLPADLHFLGALPRSPQYTLPERHLGLVQAAEVEDLEARIDAAATALGGAVDFAAIPDTGFAQAQSLECPPLLRGVRIAVAQDAAFSFIYAANLDTLRQLGAELQPFSPLRDPHLPSCDALYLPGGYPELHAAGIAANTGMRDSLRAHHAAGKPLLAECGGMMALFERLVDRDGRSHPMAGLLPGSTAMQPQLQALALQAVTTGEGELRGHSFHYSRLETPLTAALRGRTSTGTDGEAVYRDRRLTASYIHFYFPSNPAAAAALFQP